MPYPHHTIFRYLRLRHILLALAAVVAILLIGGKLGWIPKPPVEQPVPRRVGH